MSVIGVDLSNGMNVTYLVEGEKTAASIPLANIQTDSKDTRQRTRTVTDDATLKAELEKQVAANRLIFRQIRNGPDEKTKTLRELSDASLLETQASMNQSEVYYQGTGTGTEVIVKPAGSPAPQPDDWPSAAKRRV